MAERVPGQKFNGLGLVGDQGVVNGPINDQIDEAYRASTAAAHISTGWSAHAPAQQQSRLCRAGNAVNYKPTQ